MPNYQNGKIYSIRSRSRDDLVYVGSTCCGLSVRFGQHKLVGNKASSKQIVELGDAYIELIENYACGSKEELNRREGQLIRSMVCVNKRIEGRTATEYYHDNREEICERKKQYYTDNKERIAADRKQYYTENKKRMKQYYTDNKEKISLQAKQKIDCECGAIICRKVLRIHKRTKKHIRWQQIYDFIHS